MTSLTELPLFAIGKLIRERNVSPVEYTQCVLARINSLDPKIRAFTRVEPDIALSAAAAAEAEIVSGRYRGPLHGIPYALKDLIDYARVPTTANSRILQNNVPAEHAHVTQLLESSGAIFIGKVVTGEFACGGAPTDSLYPAPLNPWNTSYITAGSSSGSAVSVASELVPLALGTDTNGSIRGPSSRCGTVGMKPTYGRVSRRGVFPLAPSQDHVGPLTRTVRDNACALQVIAGRDPRDRTCRDIPVHDYLHALEGGVKGLRIGVIKNVYLNDPYADPEKITALEEAIALLEQAGAEIIELTLHRLEQFTAVARAILSTEGYSIHEKWLKSVPELYGTGCKKRLLQGAFFSAANYLHTQRLRSRLVNELLELMSQVDVVLTASDYDATPRVDDAPAIERWYLHQMHMPFNVSGHPALVLPSGLSKKTGMPLSMQIVGHHFDESMVYRVAYTYEQLSGNSNLRPPLAVKH